MFVKMTLDLQRPVTSSFRHFLADDDVLVYQRSVAAFAEFAEVAAQEEAVSLCLPQNEEKQTNIVAYLSKVGLRSNFLPRL